MADYIIELRLTNTTPHEVTTLVADLHHQLGHRIRTRTVEKWLWEQERTPPPPFRARTVPGGTVHQVRLRQQTGKRAER